tara:strand:- start:2497 stop:3450 length:954 start_codon:yes stop_codon:yes gene_type:complete
VRSLISLEAIEVLDAIQRKGSYAAAASHLNKVPSALSYTVQKLEQDLAVTLFQKQGRRSVLTSAGEHLLEQGRKLLLAAEQLSHSTQQVASGWEPRLRIACDTAVPSSWLYPLLEKLYQLQSNIIIELSEEVLGGTWEALIENRVDLIVGAVNRPPGHQGIRCLEWFDSDMCFVANPQHPIMQAQQPLSADSLNLHRSVIVRDSSRNLPTLNYGILNRRQYMYVASMAEKINAQRNGLGVGLAPRFRVAESLALGELVELQLEQPPAPSPLHIAWKTANRGQALQWLVEQLQQLQPCHSPGQNLAIGVPKRTGILKI